jgi:diguanylate cyclase
LRAEAQLNDFQARHDTLTDLPNRTLFRERLDDVLVAGESRCAVLLLDVDRFKEINDTLGHHNGDKLLAEMAVRLTQNVGPAGLVARLSGDEYAVLVVQPTTDHGSIEAHAVEVARTIASAFASPFQIEGLELVMTASIGISLSPDHGLTADTLIRRADVAMYNAKRDHGAGFEVYRADRDEYSAARLALVADLRNAVDGDQIEVAYQMQVDAATGNVEGAEALVRWRHPVRGVLPPLAFVGLAEHAGLIRGLTERVLRLAVHDAVEWRRRWPNLRVAVNIAPRTLLDPTLPPLVRQVLAEHALPPSALTLEVTESAIVDNAHRVEEALRDLTSLGCTIAIDDFGTGYSSFSYLRRLSIHELKIDRLFVQGMTTDASDLAIVELTVDLGHRLGKRVVAEGVETDQQAEGLVRAGCDVLQGFLFSLPVSSEAFMDAVEARAPGSRHASPPGPRDDDGEPCVVPLARLRSLQSIPNGASPGAHVGSPLAAPDQMMPGSPVVLGRGRGSPATG